MSSQTLVDLYNGILKYNDKDVVIVIDNDNQIWFYGRQVAKILNYKDTNDAIRKKVFPENKLIYEHIKEFSKYKYNIQDHAIFINEPGLYQLILRSKMKDARNFQYWITNEVIPQIRKTGKYEVDKETKTKFDDLQTELDEYKKRIKILENNQKKEKYPDGGYIYIIKPPDLDDELYKVGKVDKNLKNRINVYNTSYPDKFVVVEKIKVNSPIAVELCVKGFLYNFRYRNNKEYYKLPVSEILKAISTCNDMICGKKKLLRRSMYENMEKPKEDDIYGLLAVTKEQAEENRKYEKIKQTGGKLFLEIKHNKYKFQYLENKRNYYLIR